MSQVVIIGVWSQFEFSHNWSCHNLSFKWFGSTLLFCERIFFVINFFGSSSYIFQTVFGPKKYVDKFLLLTKFFWSTSQFGPTLIFCKTKVFGSYLCVVKILYWSNSLLAQNIWWLKTYFGQQFFWYKNNYLKVSGQ